MTETSFTRRTYHIRRDQADRLAELARTTRDTESSLVREAIDLYIDHAVHPVIELVRDACRELSEDADRLLERLRTCEARREDSRRDDELRARVVEELKQDPELIERIARWLRGEDDSLS